MALVLIVVATFLALAGTGDAGAEPRPGRMVVTESGVVDVGDGIQISAISIARGSP